MKRHPIRCCFCMQNRTLYLWVPPGTGSSAVWACKPCVTR